MAATTVSQAEMRALEELSFNAWPALRQVVTGGWLLRFARGYTKRANSVNALQPDGRPLDQVVAEAQAHFAALGLPAIWRLTPLAPPGTDERLAALGLRAVEPSVVLTAPLGAETRAQPGVTLDAGEAPWVRGFAAMRGLDAASAATLGAMIAAIVPRKTLAVIEEGGTPVAFGMGVVERGRIGLFDILTAPAARGRGLGGRVVETLLAWGRAHGAAAAYLQVTEDNAPALAIYRRLGFTPAYPYWYRVPA